MLPMITVYRRNLIHISENRVLEIAGYSKSKYDIRSLKLQFILFTGVSCYIIEYEYN